MDRKGRLYCWVILLAVLFFNGANALAAQPQLLIGPVIRPVIGPVIDDQLDLRQTRIARISLLEGEASIQHINGTEWDAAFLNVPISAGDLIYTGGNAQLELQINGGFVRLNEYTTIEVVELNARSYRFDVTSGTVTFSLSEGRADNVEISTPQSAITVKKDGVYRVNVASTGDTEVIVHRGEAELYGNNGEFKLREGRRANFTSANNYDIEISSNILLDYWDSWSEARDNLVLANNNSFNYVGRNTFGVSDLDQYGSWVDVPYYGSVWQPRGVPIGWAPYRVGRWSYYSNYGWTWISYEPWGWLPYHYGSWVFLAYYGWVWQPNNIGYYWSPGLVSWYTVVINNVNYVCWRPRQNNNQPISHPNTRPDKPISPIKPGQPVEHNGKTVPNKIDGTTIDRTDFDADGITTLSESDFVNGHSPTEKPVKDLVDRIKGNRGVKVGAIPRPVRTGIPAMENSPKPTPEVLSKPVIVRSNNTITLKPGRLGDRSNKGTGVKVDRVFTNPPQHQNNQNNQNNSANDQHPTRHNNNNDGVKPTNPTVRDFGKPANGNLNPSTDSPTRIDRKNSDNNSKPIVRNDRKDDSPKNVDRVKDEPKVVAPNNIQPRNKK